MAHHDRHWRPFGDLMKLLKVLILTGISSFCLGGGFSGTTGGGGGGGYNVQPASVTFQLNQGVTATTATVSSLTSGQVVYPTTGGLLIGSPGYTTDGSSVTVSTAVAGIGIFSGQVGAANISSTSTLVNQTIFSSNYDNKSGAPPVVTVKGSYDTGDLAIEAPFFRIDNRVAQGGTPLSILSFARSGADKIYEFWDASYDGGGGIGCLYVTPQISPSVSGWMSCFGTVGGATTPVYNSFGKNITPTRKDGIVQIIPNSGTEVGVVIYENAQSTSTDMFELKDSSDTNILGRFDGGANGTFPSITLTSSASVVGSGGLGVTYGVIAATMTAQSFTANGSGAGQYTATEASFTVTSAGAGTDLFWADSGSHTFVFNPNNTSTFTIAGTSTTATAGHSVIFGTRPGSLLDGGTPSVGGSSGYNLQPSTITPNFQYGTQTTSMTGTAFQASLTSFSVVGVGGFAIANSSAGQISMTEGAASTVIGNGSNIDTLWADSTAHALLTNYNGTASTGTIVTSTGTPTAGNMAIFGTTPGSLLDGGAISTGASLLPSTNTWTGVQIFKSSVGVVTSNLTVSISTNGYIGYSGGSAPTFSGCGTTPTVTAGSDNMRGSVTMTAGLSSACTIIPATPSPQNYFCVISGGGSGTGVFFQQSANLTGSCDNATGLVSCGVGTFMTWNCTGTN